MIALRDRWTPTSRLFSRVDKGQPRKFVADYGIAWQNYLDGNGVFQEISLVPQPSDIVGYNWMVPGLPFKPYLAINGARRIFVDRNSQTKRIDFPASKFLANKTFTKVGNSLVWSSNAYDVVMRWENSRIKFDVVVKRNIPFDQVQFDVDKTGLSDAELLAFMTNLTATDSSPEPIVRPLSVSLVAGVLTLGFDLTGMTFPVTIDPTLDLQVGASADDGQIYAVATEGSGGTFDTDFTLFGRLSSTHKRYAWYRFTGITLSGTIDVAYLTFIAFDNFTGTVCSIAIWGNDVAATVAPTTSAEYWALVKTTASTAWTVPAFYTDTAYNTPSVVSTIQELVDSYSYNNGNMQLMAYNTGVNDDTLRFLYDYNNDTTKAAKLHVEYTAGGAARRMAVIG